MRGLMMPHTETSSSEYWLGLLCLCSIIALILAYLFTRDTRD
jgi:hypothetical protein